MAVSFVKWSKYGVYNGSTISQPNNAWNDVARGAGEGLVLGLYWYLNASDPTVTWDPAGDNQTFTKFGSTVNINGSGGVRTAIFYLAAPTSVKTGTVRIQFGSATDMYYNVGVMAHVTGHDTTTMLRSGSFGSDDDGGFSNVSPLSTTVTSATDDLVLDFVTWRTGTGENMTLGAGQSNGTVQEPTGTSFPTVWASTKAGASSVTMERTTTGSGWYGAQLVASVQASAGGGATLASRMTLLRVGR